MGVLAWVAEVDIELPKRGKGTKSECPFLPLLWASQLWSPVCTPNSVLIRKTVPGDQQPALSSTMSAILSALSEIVFLRLPLA